MGGTRVGVALGAGRVAVGVGLAWLFAALVAVGVGVDAASAAVGKPPSTAAANRADRIQARITVCKS